MLTSFMGLHTSWMVDGCCHNDQSVLIDIERVIDAFGRHLAAPECVGQAPDKVESDESDTGNRTWLGNSSVW